MPVVRCQHRHRVDIFTIYNFPEIKVSFGRFVRFVILLSVKIINQFHDVLTTANPSVPVTRAFLIEVANGGYLYPFVGEETFYVIFGLIARSDKGQIYSIRRTHKSVFPKGRSGNQRRERYCRGYNASGTSNKCSSFHVHILVLIKGSDEIQNLLISGILSTFKHFRVAIHFRYWN